MFSVTRFGNPVIIMGSYRYNRNNRYLSGPKVFWTCSPKFAVSRFGNPVILIGRYRFNKNNRSRGPSAMWFCSKSSLGCRASIKTIDNVIIKESNEHNH
ncbi:hypothetical protein JYU34_004431 [Plutella xylostella]|uniref:FLYWCH-type domain-containing protein n=1 Tax=Plutella xylostella TaxID=51655 RepID=A0ABQ7QXY9_PLUXY|nr:hypothetical protein JYU34_004431 [Plutella xylostella]